MCSRGRPRLVFQIAAIRRTPLRVEIGSAGQSVSRRARSGPSCAPIGLPIAVVPRLLSVSVANPEGIRDDASQMVGAPDIADGGGEEKASSCTPPVFISWLSAMKPPRCVLSLP
jgi:hypothetical protein